MCCSVNDTVVPFVAEEEEQVFFKVVRANRTPPYYYNTLNPIYYSIDYLVYSDRASRELNVYEEISGYVSRGIHVFLTEEAVEKARQNLVTWRGTGDDGYQVIRVLAYKKDLVAAGYWDGVVTFPVAVFMKVQVLD